MSTATSACAVKPAITPRPKLVSVNGTVIPREAIARETQNHPASRPIEAWKAAARALVVRELLLQEARRIGIAATSLADDEGRRETEEEALIRALVEQEIRPPVPQEEELRRLYAARRRLFRTPDLLEASHILLAVRDPAPEARAALKERAEALLEALRQRPEAFTDLALRHSDCPSGKQGGALGQISDGQTVPEFEAALAAMEPGDDRFTLVESRYGFHLVCLHRRIPGRELPFEQVREAIAARLEAQAQAMATRHYLLRLAGAATISGIEFETPATPLVQ